MLELGRTGHIKREEIMCSGFALHCLLFSFPPVFLMSFLYAVVFKNMSFIDCCFGNAARYGCRFGDLSKSC